LWPIELRGDGGVGQRKIAGRSMNGHADPFDVA
jgi:hypothetical protein